MTQTIINQDKTTGNTIMILSDGVDCGEILSQIVIVVDPNETLLTLENKVIDFGVPQLVETLQKYKQNKIKPVTQNESKATYTQKIQKEDGFIALKEDPQLIYAKYRAFLKWPGIYTTVGDLENFLSLKTKIHNKQEIVKITKCSLSSSSNQLMIEELLLPNKKPMSLKDFLNGYKI